MQQELQPVAVRDPFHRFHHQHVVVGGDIGVFKRHRQLVLGRRNLVVPRLHRNAQLVKLGLALEHARKNALGNCAEVVVFHLLPLGGLGSEKRPAGVDQVRPRK